MKRRRVVIQCGLSIGMTLLIFVLDLMMQYYGDILGVIREIGAVLLDIISLIAIWSKKHRKAYQTYLYIVGVLLFECILLITIWSRKISENERLYVMLGFDDISIIIDEMVAGFVGAVMIMIPIAIVIGIYRLVKKYKQ